MRFRCLLSLVSAGILCLSGCSKTDLEASVSDFVWFNQSLQEAILFDRSQSTMFLQSVKWIYSEDPSVVHKNGRATSVPYSVVGNKFVFAEGIYQINGFITNARRCEEAWFDTLGNLIVQVGFYTYLGDGNFMKESDHAYLFLRKPLSFLPD